MSLKIYWNKEDVPNETEFIYDNELFFVQHTLSKLDSRADNLLTRVDKAKYLDKKRFTDKFGTAVYWSYLSTGGKTILNIFYNPDKCFSSIECGINAMDEILKLSQGQVQMQHIRKVPLSDDACDVEIDGSVYTSLQELEEMGF